MANILYLTRTGLLEPLGQSQVLAYLKGLSREHRIAVVSYERADDLADVELVGRIEATCREHGIEWVRKTYRNRPRRLAALWNLVELFWTTFALSRRREADLIHARSYIPAASAWLVNRLTGVPFIFDMRSLWAEELVTSNRARRGSLVHRAIVGMERRMLRDAAIVVSLTRAGADWLTKEHAGAFDPAKFRFIPTCTDIDRFVPPAGAREGPLLVGCHGSILSGWFRPELLRRCFARIAELRPDARFEVVTREDPDDIRKALRGGDGFAQRLDIYKSAAGDIHEVLARQDLSVFFYASGAASELGRSPTRMGESLGCGVPVLTNGQVGDVAEIVAEHDVGVVLEGDSDADLHRAIDKVLPMLRSADVARRCRNAAETVYSLTAGTEAYSHIYMDIVEGAAISKGQVT